MRAKVDAVALRRGDGVGRRGPVEPHEPRRLRGAAERREPLREQYAGDRAAADVAVAEDEHALRPRPRRPCLERLAPPQRMQETLRGSTYTPQQFRHHVALRKA